MKIAFYINGMGGGGAERVVAVLASFFIKHYDVIVINSYPIEHEYILATEIKHLYLERNKKYRSVLIRNIKRIYELRKILKTEKPDIIVSFMAEPNFRTLIAARGLNVKTIVSVRNDPNKEYPNFIYRFLAKHLYKKADGIVFQTEDAQKWFPKSIQKKSKIIFNQVDEIFYNTIYNGERHDIVTTGRLVAQKNHKMLIRAFAAIADKISDNLIIYGEGELRGELESLIAELHLENRVFLPGRVKNVADTIKSAKLFVLSSDYEGMPNSLMEAMALGIPCVSTDCPCGGPRMLFGEDAEDKLVPCDDVKKLSMRIFQELYNLENGTTERKHARTFHPDHVSSDWEEYLNFVERKYKGND